MKNRENDVAETLEAERQRSKGGGEAFIDVYTNFRDVTFLREYASLVENFVGLSTINSESWLDISVMARDSFFDRSNAKLA